MRRGRQVAMRILAQVRDSSYYRPIGNAVCRRFMGGFSGGKNGMTYQKLAIREKEQRLIQRLRTVLASKEKVSISQFWKLGRQLGFKSKSGLIFVERFPTIFKVVETESGRVVELTDTVVQLMEREQKMMKEHEPYLVNVLRKLLMLSTHGRIPVAKLDQMKPSFGLPDDFEKSILPNYPESFGVISDTKDGKPILELRHWDPALAVTVHEKKLKRFKQGERDVFGEGGPYSFRVPFENNCTMGRSYHKRLLNLQKVAFPSPYDHSQSLDPDSQEARKRRIAVCHEFLSLTVLKRAIVRDIANFKKEFQLCDSMEKFFWKEKHFFATERLNNYFFVFLREAYHWDYKLEVTPYMEIRKEFVDLARICRRKRPVARSCLPNGDLAQYGANGEGDDLEEDDENYEDDEDEDEEDDDDDDDEDNDKETDEMEDGADEADEAEEESDDVEPQVLAKRR